MSVPPVWMSVPLEVPKLIGTAGVVVAVADVDREAGRHRGVVGDGHDSRAAAAADSDLAGDVEHGIARHVQHAAARQVGVVDGHSKLDVSRTHHGIAAEVQRAAAHFADEGSLADSQGSARDIGDARPGGEFA